MKKGVTVAVERKTKLIDSFIKPSFVNFVQHLNLKDRNSELRNIRIVAIFNANERFSTFISASNPTKQLALLLSSTNFDTVNKSGNFRLVISAV